jgi:hypothetical protein
MLQMVSEKAHDRELLPPERATPRCARGASAVFDVSSFGTTVADKRIAAAQAAYVSPAI